MGSPIRTKFFDEEYSIDRENTIVLLRDDATSGWLLSSPLTTTFSTMHLSKPRQDSMSPYSHSPSHSPPSMREFERRTVACRQTSKELQHRFSISSDSSDPGLTDDPYLSSPSPNSITSFEDPHNCNPSAVDLAAEKIWMQFFTDQSPIKVSLLESPLYHDFPPALSRYAPSEVHLSPRNHSPVNPNNISYPGDLRRSDVVRSSRDRSKTIQVVRPQPSYTAFPVAAPPQPSHQSWPQRNESRAQHPSHQPPQQVPARPTRSRAYTAPSQARVVRPSNLNVCTSANDHPSISYPYPPSTSHSHSHSNSNRFYTTRSAPPTPLVLPILQPDIVEQFVSHFDEDDDDEEHHSVFGSLKSRLYSSGGSWGRSSHKAGGGSFEKRKKNPRKSLSELRDALKGCFGKTK